MYADQLHLVNIQQDFFPISEISADFAADQIIASLQLFFGRKPDDLGRALRCKRL